MLLTYAVLSTKAPSVFIYPTRSLKPTLVWIFFHGDSSRQSFCTDCSTFWFFFFFWDKVSLSSSLDCLQLTMILLPQPQCRVTGMSHHMTPWHRLKDAITWMYKSWNYFAIHLLIPCDCSMHVWLIQWQRQELTFVSFSLKAWPVN